jgi:hypothetical protein
MNMGQGRRTAIALSVLVFASGLSGCEPWRRQAIRSDMGAGQSGQAARALEDPSFSRPEELKGFFKGNRKAGTLSPEAREIEESLGAVNR